jgi:flagellar hook-length control protein FliK
MEMPGYAATDVKGVQTAGTIKGGRNAAQAVISDFKKKLDSLSAAGQPAVQAVTDTPAEDLSMATGAAAQELPQGVVGILEGFGLLDGQTDMSATPADAGETAAVHTQAPETAGTQQAQTSGQFARMLIDEQSGAAAADVPQQPDAGAGKYSGSLESTNSGTMAAEPAANGDEAAILQLKAKMAADATAQPAQAAAAATQGTATEAQAMARGTATEAQAAAQTAAAGAQAAAADVPEPATAGADTGGQQADDEPQDQPAAKTAPTATASVNADAAAVRAPQTDATARAGDAQSAAAQQAESGFVKDNVIRIVDKVSASVQEGKYEFDVELKPDFLGKVSIRLTMQDGEIRVHVRTDDPAVKGMFSDQTNSLTAALKEKGIALSAVDVSYQDPMATGREAFAQSGNGGGQKREGQAGWTADRYNGGEMFETLVPVSELLGGSSVEYLA